MARAWDKELLMGIEPMTFEHQVGALSPEQQEFMETKLLCDTCPAYCKDEQCQTNYHLYLLTDYSTTTVFHFKIMVWLWCFRWKVFIYIEYWLMKKFGHWELKSLNSQNFCNETIILLELVYPHVEVGPHRIGKFGITHDNMQKMWVYGMGYYMYFRQSLTVFQTL